MLGVRHSRESEHMKVNPVDEKIEANHHKHSQYRCPRKILARINDFSTEFAQNTEAVVGHHGGYKRTEERSQASVMQGGL